MTYVSLYSAILLVKDEALVYVFTMRITDLTKQLMLQSSWILVNLWPVFIFETTMSQMSKEEFCLPYPFPRKGSHQAPASSEDFQRVVVESCVESQSSFNLKLIIPKGNLVSGDFTFLSSFHNRIF